MSGNGYSGRPVGHGASLSVNGHRYGGAPAELAKRARLRLELAAACAEPLWVPGWLRVQPPWLREEDREEVTKSDVDAGAAVGDGER